MQYNVRNKTRTTLAYFRHKRVGGLWWAYLQIQNTGGVVQGRDEFGLEEAELGYFLDPQLELSNNY